MHHQASIKKQLQDLFWGLMVVLFIPVAILTATGKIKWDAPAWMESWGKTEAPEDPSASMQKKIHGVEKRYGGSMKMVAERHGRDWRDLLAQVVIESGGDPKAVSRSGAMGLMQIKSIVLEDIGRKDIRFFHPWENLWAGAKYMNVLRDRYGYKTLYEQLVAYHDGPRGARKFLARHAPEEHFYVKRFLKARAAVE